MHALDMLSNAHARRVAALLRHTVGNPHNPHAPALPLAWGQWDVISRIAGSDNHGIANDIPTLMEAFTDVIASIHEHTRLSIGGDDIQWLITSLQDNPSCAIILLAMASMEQRDDMIGLADAADSLGHASPSTVRQWCDEGTLLSARKIARNWTVARSEIDLLR